MSLLIFLLVLKMNKIPCGIKMNYVLDEGICIVIKEVNITNNKIGSQKYLLVNCVYTHKSKILSFPHSYTSDFLKILNEV